MKNIFCLITIAFLCGCMTPKGDYHIVAEDEFGRDLAPNIKFVAQNGTGITSTKISLCAGSPGAIIRVYDLHTNEEIKSLSPRKCR